jgi:outer membrane receptor protein involved in Fe transport
VKHPFSFLPFLAIALIGARADDPATTTKVDGPTVELNAFVVTGELDRAREATVPSLGASLYQIDRVQILALPEGANNAFSQVLLQVPGMVQDSFGQLHLRGEHANLQYRIDEVLLPESVGGFGQELDPRFIDTVSVLTGSLPAQYGFRTAGIVDIHTKSGANARGGDVSLYGGSHDTIHASFESGGASGPFDYFVTGSILSNNLGIENPTASRAALHDRTQQAKGFGYFSYLLDPTSRFTLLLSGSTADFQIPDNPGQTPAFSLQDVPAFDSASLQEKQREDSGYAVVSYQKTTSAVSAQAAVFTRTSSVKFTPDAAGDLIFNGIASRVQRDIVTSGLQSEFRWSAAETHTLRGGFLASVERGTTDTVDLVFPADATGRQTATGPFALADQLHKRAYLYGAYAQDEWQPAEHWTVNYGLRADAVDAFVREGQLSPRLNVVFTPTDRTTWHLGYARYFTPPPLELLRSDSVARFAGTTNAPEVTIGSPVRSERAHYFDLGVTQKLTSAWSLGLDSYYKQSRDLLDEGQFGQALIYSPFNYQTGQVYGLELSANYAAGGFSAYGNVALNRATGRHIVSSEFLFGRDELDYIATHDVALDHDQRITASSGLTYKQTNAVWYADALYGTGLRRGFANTGKLPAYATVNLGVDWRIWRTDRGALHLRIDVVNVFDEIYELRDGSGIGVGAPQFGARRGFFGGLAWKF